MPSHLTANISPAIKTASLIWAGGAMCTNELYLVCTTRLGKSPSISWYFTSTWFINFRKILVVRQKICYYIRNAVGCESGASHHSSRPPSTSVDWPGAHPTGTTITVLPGKSPSFRCCVTSSHFHLLRAFAGHTERKPSIKRSSYGERGYTFGEIIRTLRTAIGLTQAGLADHLGVSQRAVGEWEAGSSYPKPNHLKQYMTHSAKHQAST